MTYPPSAGDWQDPARPLTGVPDDSPQHANPGQQPIPSAPTSSQPGPGQPTGGVLYPPTGPYPGAYPAGGYPQPTYPGYGYPQPKTNGLATVALVLSLVGIVFCLTAPAGAILGHVAQKQIRETGEGGDGVAKAAIISGWILTGLAALVAVFYVVVFVVMVFVLVAAAETTSTV
ncbi:DUF4190 domain-containing protein [Salinispora mooreana]|uniref:DUF4190 domain-containing protein n=1 Tax=Salinispora mooreana TaxID=999545 RepID=UPI0003826077|nr:DUF4190 domain-containing protein [Salinispora mooreana]